MMKRIEKRPGIMLQCGWGRLLFADTFADPDSVAGAILEEKENQRDIAIYLVDPHLVLNCAPQRIFLDPSNTYRLSLADYAPDQPKAGGFTVRPLRHKEEIDEINRIYAAQRMVPVDAAYVWKNRDAEEFTYMVAVEEETDNILGVAMGADHEACAPDLLHGRCSLWALAVDPQAAQPGIGKALVHSIIEFYAGRGRQELDISVLHDNEKAIALYRKLGFKRVYIFSAKHRNSINEQLFVGTPVPEEYNVYASIIIREALRRGISVDPVDPARNHFKLRLGGRTISCWESLTEMTTAIAVVRASDKQLTRKLLRESGIATPDQILAGEQAANLRFLNRHLSVVVKPLHGEQGKGVSVDIRTPEDLEAAIKEAARHGSEVLIEQYVEGEDLRVIVINDEVVAAAVRRPPMIMGTGQHSIRDLIKKLSRRRSASTDRESFIPVDEETERCVRLQGYSLDDTLPAETSIAVRKTANLHTGGTIHDVTDSLHTDLADAALRAARALEMPVVGLDFIVDAVDKPAYVVIEANERPGLANHEPQPVAARFMDFLFPQSIAPTPGNLPS